MEFILKRTEAESGEQIICFKNALNLAHNFTIYKEIIEAAASLAYLEKLDFKILNKRFSENNDGLCRTHLYSFYGKLKKRLSKHRKHSVILKKNELPVIVHEIAHAVEKELPRKLFKDFGTVINQDLCDLTELNPLIRKTVEKFMIKEVGFYPKGKHKSELFARYFEIHSYSKEISNKEPIPMKEYELFFKRTDRWRKLDLVPYLNERVIIKGLFKRETVQKNSIEKTTTWSARNKSIFD